MSQTTPKPKAKKEVRDIRADALKIANSIKIEGQDKAHTKAIAKGIQQGMEMFLRQQSEKSRELDKKVKKVKQLSAAVAQRDDSASDAVTVSASASKLPWILLIASWALFITFTGLYWYLK